MSKEINKTENKLIDAIDEADLYTQLKPIIAAALKYGGGADTILRKSQAVAAVKLLELLNSDRDDVRLKAADKILDRSVGKAVERKINIYADLDQLTPAEVDRRLKALMAKHSPSDVIDAVIEAKAKEPKE